MHLVFLAVRAVMQCVAYFCVSAALSAGAFGSMAHNIVSQLSCRWHRHFKPWVWAASRLSCSGLRREANVKCPAPIRRIGSGPSACGSSRKHESRMIECEIELGAYGDPPWANPMADIL